MEARCVLLCLVLVFSVALTEKLQEGFVAKYWNGEKCICTPPTSGQLREAEHPRPFYELFPGLGYYKLHTNLKSWHEAKLICEKEGAHLAVINSQEEVEVMRELRRRLPNVIGTWEDDHSFIGINDIQHEGVWRTVNDVPLRETGFVKWAQHEPNGGTNENCGILITSQGSLNDAPCTVRRGFFCEREL